MQTIYQRILKAKAEDIAVVNPVLAFDEIGLETNTGKYKNGNGTTRFSLLAYAASGGNFFPNAYNESVAAGFVGTLQEWFAELQSETYSGEYLSVIDEATRLASNATALEILTSEIEDVIGGGIQEAIDALVDAAPGTLNTLNELAAALADDPNFAATMAASIANKQTKVAGVYVVSDYGTVDTTGVADSSTAVLAAITAWQLTGGELVFPAGTIRVDSQIVLTNDGAGQPKQRSGRWKGQGATFNGSATAITPPYGGTILDLRYTGGGSNLAKIDTRGLGAIEITGITFTDFGTSSNPFIHSTNTTILAHHNAFIGNLAKATTTCDQDAFILGGYSTGTPIDGSYEAPFQGYGTVIEKNYFARIRRGALLQSYANSITFKENTFWANCGSNLANGAAIEILPNSASGYAVGNTIWGNLIECSGYVYAIKADWAVNNLFMNHIWDYGGSMLAAYYFGAEGKFNTITAGRYTDTLPLVIEHASSLNSNTQINGQASRVSVAAQPWKFPSLVSTEFSGAPVLGSSGGVAFLAQPATTQPETQVYFRARRSAAEATNPSTTIFQLTQDGNIVVGGSAAGNILFTDAAGVNRASFGSGLKSWSALGTGGAMSQDSGSGGSYFTMQNYGVKLLDHTGANAVTIKNGTGTPEGNFAAPVGSIFLRTNGGTGTTLYVKETGAATNAGWVAATPTAPSTGWAVSNVTTDKVLDANATSIDELADVLGTLITTLISRGVLSA